jgi:hypothetical protein
MNSYPDEDEDPAVTLNGLLSSAVRCTIPRIMAVLEFGRGKART